MYNYNYINVYFITLISIRVLNVVHKNEMIFLAKFFHSDALPSKSDSSGRSTIDESTLTYRILTHNFVHTVCAYLYILRT